MRRLFVHRLTGCTALILAAVFLLPYMGTAFAVGEALCGQQEHMHTEECYQQECVCTWKEAEQGEPSSEPCQEEEHTHRDQCYIDLKLLCCTEIGHEHVDSCYTWQPTLQCGKSEHVHGADCTPSDAQVSEPHIHSEDCYQLSLICTQKEHTHTEDCIPDTAADIEQPEDWEATLPQTNQNASAKDRLASVAVSQLGYRESERNFRLDDNGNRRAYTRYGAWYGDPYGAWNGMFVAFCLYYADVSEQLIPHSSSADSMFSNAKKLTPTAETPQRGMLVFYKNEKGDTHVGIITKVDGSKITYIAGDLDGAVTECSGDWNAPAVLGIADPDGTVQEKGMSEKDTSLQEQTDISLMTAMPQAEGKAEKDNSAMLERVRCTDTREYITLNLYNYGNNINDKYRSNNKYPGFQQEYGTLSGKTVSDSNFGNNITKDLAAGINGLTNQGGGINRVTDRANSPVSKVENVMYPKLKNGYPALADGTSLGYLFGADQTYGKKQNSKNISGLFRYNEKTGAYTYNSRENHAQFDPDSDTFHVYKQMLTPNMTMYPFGNFLPLNDIVHDAKRVSDMDRAYLLQIASSAQARQDAGESKYNNEYQTLATSMKNWIAAMDAAYPSGWNAANAIDAYFNAYVGSGFDFAKETALLNKLYCLDYDVPTDFYFGLEMEMSFMQPRSGLTGADGKQPMRFYFTGDDDVWVYVDDVLFLDLSGIHRHVGGEIDFEKGIVRYFSLDPGSGDVSSSPWREVRFSEILGSMDQLNDVGTFENYSVHNLHFYYMERGSGSGVCCLNFNMPLLREDSISITKELTVEDGDISILGDPEFCFQVLREDGTLFVKEGKEYQVLNTAGQTVDTRTVDKNGVLRIKAGQTAVIGGVAENAGTYFVRELLDADTFAQYGTVSVDGSTVTSDHYTDAVIGAETFYGVNSNVKDAADGSTLFRFENHVSLHKLGTLEIQKFLESFSPSRSNPQFRFRVLFDTVPLAVGETYTVISADGDEKTNKVEEEGIILLAAGETARLGHILAGTRFIVEELDAKQAGYSVQYVVDGGAVTDGYASGTIGVDATAKVAVTNVERGASVRIPIRKILTVDDKKNTSFSILLEEVEDAEGSTLRQDGISQSLTVSAEEAGEFLLAYAEPSLTEWPSKFYYRITEQLPAAADAYRYDGSVYIVEVTVNREEDGTIAASVTDAWKNGESYDVQRPIAFCNTRLTSMTVEKKVRGITVSPDAVFQAKLQFTVNGAPWQDNVLIQSQAGAAHHAPDSEGVLLLELHADEPIMISELPFGAQWTLTEQSADGYLVSISVDGASAIEGAAASGTLSETGTHVSIINASTHVPPTATPVPTPRPPLVQTGFQNNSLYFMVISGAAMLGIGLWFLLSRRKQ